ncbi:hypothetical protein EDC04DRAFT_2608919 [Pisolithus marmoratus]|nr:hypothetical protein EDC04DRAFT_2608919 [Pisolithus marmoratus]
MSKSTFTLWYWVRGTPLRCITSIEASPETNVDTLKKRIFESQPDLQGGPIRANLYKIPDTHLLPADGEYEHGIGGLSISDLGQPLRSARKLSNIFAPQPKEDHLHLVLDATIMIINVYIRGGDPLHSVSISLSNQARVNELKNRFKETCTDFVNTSTNRLAVYKLSFDGHDELKEILDKYGDGTFLPGEQKLETFFNDLPFSQEAARVVVEVLPEEGTRAPPSSKPFPADGDTVLEARKTYLRASSPEKPSTTAMPSSFLDRQNNSRKAIPCGRPRKYEDFVPTVLLHPVFGQFIEDTKEIEVSAEDNKLVIELADAMSDLYKNEAERIDKVETVLKTFDIHFASTTIKRTGFQTDGDMAVKDYRYAIAEFKNEAGNTSGEPYFRPYIVFAGAAWNLRPTIQLLSMPVAFNIHSTDTDNLLVLARHMAAFRKAAQTLKRYYEDLRPTQLLPNMPSPQLFPYPTTYTSTVDGTNRQILYQQQLEHKLVFFGTESTEGSAVVDRICVKFVRRYSPGAHEHCASAGCAPALRGFKKIPGGWFMVVMDDLSNDYETLANMSVPVPTKSLIRAKLAGFHKAGFVHGDIRDTNIMVSKSDNTQFRIIDFDWAGIAGEVKYPAFLNPEVRRPEAFRTSLKRQRWLMVRGTSGPSFMDRRSIILVRTSDFSGMDWIWKFGT